MTRSGLSTLCLCSILALYALGCDDGGNSNNSNDPQCNPACSVGTVCVFMDGSEQTHCEAINDSCNPPCAADQSCVNGACVTAECNDDGVCDAGETSTSCPADCPTCNNNGVCDEAAGETSFNCSADCTTAPAGLTCAELFDCMMDCEADETCQSDCSSRATEPVRQTLGAFLECYEGSGCQDQACLEQQCPQQIQACFVTCDNDGTCEAANGETAQGCADCAAGCNNNGQCEAQQGETEQNCADCGGSGADTCSQIWSCMGQCPNEDQPCLDGCVARGSQDGVAALQAMFQCFQNSGCSDDPCLEQQCANEIDGCLGTPCDNDGACEPENGETAQGCADCAAGCNNDGQCDAEQGETAQNCANDCSSSTLGCGALYECMTGCGDETCLDECAARATAPARQALGALFQCADDHGCEDDACIQQSCSTQAAACFGGACDNDGTCDAGETHESCANDCPQSTCGNGQCEAGEAQTCPQDCQQPVCGDQQCDAGEAQSCPQDCGGGSCGNGVCEDTEPQTCAQDCTGSLTCSEVYDCYDECDTEECGHGCYWDGTSTAQQQVSILEECIAASGCNAEDWDCMYEICWQAFDACFGEW